MKIAFAGSGGSGKTTLAKLVAEKYGIPYVREGVRSYMKENNISHLRGLSPEKAFEMQMWLFSKKVEIESKHDSFVTCRSYACHYAYALRWLGREELLQKKLQNYVVGNPYGQTQDDLYDIIFFCPWGAFEIEDDGVRSSLKMYQLEISYLITGILNCQDNVHRLLSVGVDERMEEIDRVIKGILLNGVSDE